jgi:hypothetical protein
MCQRLWLPRGSWLPRWHVSGCEVIAQVCIGIMPPAIHIGVCQMQHSVPDTPLNAALALSGLQKFLSGSGAPGGGGGSKSALLGDFTPVAQPAEAQPAGAVPDAASNATPPDTSAAPQYAPRPWSTIDSTHQQNPSPCPSPACLCDSQALTCCWSLLTLWLHCQSSYHDSWSHLGIRFCRYLQGLSDEERERRADGLFTEFLSSNDEKEALLCAHELAVRLHCDLEPAIMKLP